MELTQERLARLALVVAAAMLLLVGLRGLVTPRALLAPVGIRLDGVPALSEIRASVGGKNLGMAIFFLTAAAAPQLRVAGLVAVVAYMGGLTFGRLVSAVVDGVPDVLVASFFLAEASAATLALAALAVPAPKRTP